MAEYRGSVLPSKLFTAYWITNNCFHNKYLQARAGRYLFPTLIDAQRC